MRRRCGSACSPMISSLRDGRASSNLVHFGTTGFVRPGVPVFWWLLQKLPGDFAAAAHAANVVLHGVNAALVSLVAWRVGARRGEAIAAGAMFVVFPGLSEAVVWASGVQDVLMTTLVLTSVALATAERPRVVPAALASAAALLVKETAIVVPVLSALVILARGGLSRCPSLPEHAALAGRHQLDLRCWLALRPACRRRFSRLPTGGISSSS